MSLSQQDAEFVDRMNQNVCHCTEPIVDDIKCTICRKVLKYDLKRVVCLCAQRTPYTYPDTDITYCLECNGLIVFKEQACYWHMDVDDYYKLTGGDQSACRCGPDSEPFLNSCQETRCWVCHSLVREKTTLNPA